jgi:hypothetical protein
VARRDWTSSCGSSRLRRPKDSLNESGERSFRGQVREPRAAWPREVLPAFALRQGEEQIGQGDVGLEPGQQAVAAPMATRAFDADDGMRKLAERM